MPQLSSGARAPLAAPAGSRPACLCAAGPQRASFVRSLGTDAQCNSPHVRPPWLLARLALPPPAAVRRAAVRRSAACPVLSPASRKILQDKQGKQGKHARGRGGDQVSCTACSIPSPAPEPPVHRSRALISLALPRGCAPRPPRPRRASREVRATTATPMARRTRWARHSLRPARCPSSQGSTRTSLPRPARWAEARARARTSLRISRRPLQMPPPLPNSGCHAQRRACVTRSDACVRRL